MNKKEKLPHLILKQAFDRKKEITPSCSLRWLSKKIGISHSYLSAVLNNKKPLPMKYFETLCDTLEMDSISKTCLKKAIVRNYVKNKKINSGNDDDYDDEFLGSSLKSVSEYQEFSSKDYSLHDRWYFLPLLDLTTCSMFESSPEWIAKKLGITKIQASEAIKILIREQYLQMENGKLVKASLKMRFPTTKTKKSIRKYHKSMIEKAIFELEYKTNQEDFDKRLISGISIAVNPKNLEKAKQIIQRAMHDAAAVLSEGECTQLYHLNVQLISLLKE